MPNLKERLASLLRRGRQPSEDPQLRREVTQAQPPHRRAEKR